MIYGLDDLYLFKQVVDSGGMSGSARSLRLPKSTIARRMAVLEGKVGAPLFHRTGHGLVLTNFGSELYARCQGIAREAQRIFDFAAESGERVGGNLHIVYPPVLGELIIEGVAAEFALANPGVRLHLEAATKLVDPRTISADIVLHFSFDELPDADFVARRLVQSPYVLAASARLLAGAPPGSPEELESLPKLGYGLSPRSWAWHLQRGDEIRTIEFSPVLTSTQISALITAARQGVGVGSLPLAVVRRDIAEGRLVVLLPDWQPEPATLFAMYPSGRTLTAAARHFLARLDDNLSTDEFSIRQQSQGASEVASPFGQRKPKT